MKRKEILSIWAALNGIPPTTVASMRFNFAVALNKKKIKPLIDSLREARQLTDDVTAHEKEREQIALKYAIKDDAGRPLVLDGMLQLTDAKAYQEAIKPLEAKYPDAKRKLDEMERQYQSLLAEDVPAEDLGLMLFNPRDIPDLPYRVFESLFPLVDGLPEE